MMELIMEGIPATALYAGILGLMGVLLANFVLYVRLRGATAPKWQVDAALRVQANFVENVPMALVLLLVLELQGVAPMLLHILGTTLVVLRALHAWGLGTREGANYPRLIGAQGSFVVISVMGVIAIASALA